MTVSDSALTSDLLEEIAHFSGRVLDRMPDGDFEQDSALDDHSAKIMIIDDEPLNIKLVRKYLQDAGYHEFVMLTDPREAFDSIRSEQPDVILLDVMMPQVSGTEILTWVRQESSTQHLPVVILTASTDRETKLELLELGATDFLTKPVDSAEMMPRVRNAITVKQHHDHLRDYAANLERAVRVRTAELARSRLEVVHCLARAGEFRDDVTGRHVYRVGRFARIIGSELGLSEDQAHLLELAAQLHDVGKIGIPDSILHKPDKLTPEEFELMQKHCGFGKRVFEQMDDQQWQMIREHPVLGNQLLNTASSPLIRMASRIALTHHERWDGSGYPLGLAGEDIPIEGRITAIADVFDALSTKRPYKPAIPVKECFEIMREGSGSHFDPAILDAFFRQKEAIIAVQIECADVD